ESPRVGTRERERPCDEADRRREDPEIDEPADRAALGLAELIDELRREREEEDDADQAAEEDRLYPRELPQYDLLGHRTAGVRRRGCEAQHDARRGCRVLRAR